ncbi:MAG: phenylacetate-CoA oxygenase subunit PaaC [Pseudomonadales bacterium]|nr:phenylacetate-CoA oxygenase subunit PaaC [Pseudomonadales bacterium]NRA17764.1 phenylacetate-CoA oxygenase subunit PaaC [Oceanospirillaceae bacterium]
MNNFSNSTLYNYLLGLADDALILGQRTSEWCSRGPFLEEDIALSNVALDYIGRARMFYQYAAEVEGKGRSEDDLAYFRDEREFSNLLINELPNYDFAFSMVRQYFLDVHACLYLQGLTASTDQHLAAIASKAIKESRYHLKRSQTWLLQLGLGTEESNKRMQTAIDELWGYTPEMFMMTETETQLSTAGIAVNRDNLLQQWTATVTADIRSADLQIPDQQWQVVGGREGKHSEHLGHLLAQMQILQRSYPGLEW